MDFINHPYFDKVLLTAIAVILKILFDIFIKPQETIKGISLLIMVLICYVLPIVSIIWLNFDVKIANSKFTTTLIIFNLAIFIFNYFQSKISNLNGIVHRLASTELDKVEQIKQINKVQVEKIKAINENQHYILNELSKINDRIIKVLMNQSKFK